MIDIHCHVLPFVDFDGPQELGESLEMLECAVKEGVECVVATPHVTSGEPGRRMDEIKEAFDLLSENVKKEGLDIDLRLGAEVYISPDLYDFVRETPVSVDGLGRHVLVELPMHEFPAYVQSHLFSLVSEGITPVIAHPERNTRVMKNPQLLFSLSRNGVLFQINTGSFVGAFGRDVRKTAEELLSSGLCHFVASDAHNTGTRGLLMKEGRLAVRRIVGEILAKAMFEDNPARIVRHSPSRNSEN